MARAYNFAVVGLGMGGHHCKAIMNAKGAHLVAVCDHDPERLAHWSQACGCKGYSKWRDLLNDRDVKVVNIATESGTHADFGIDAVKAGKHIIVEKPVDVAPARIDKLQTWVDKTGMKCGCIFQSRFENSNILIKKAVDKGKMGRLIGVHAYLPWYRAQSYYEGPHGAWKGTWKLDGGGSLMNQGIHTVDLIQWLAGPVASVCGFYGVFNHKIEAEDQTAAVLRFANGALGTLMTTTSAMPDKPQRVYMFGTKGSFSKVADRLEFYEMDTPKERERMMRLFGGSAAPSDVGNDPMAVSTDGHTLIIEDMVRAIRHNREPAISIDSARHSVEIACAIFESSRTGREVEVGKARK